MKLVLESLDARDERLGRWHRWFAWHPVRVGEHDVRWLEHVERRGEWWGFSPKQWGWEYRLPTKGETP